MSKRTERKKTAVFQVRPDGYSIHTFELSKKLSGFDFHTIKDDLYRSQEGKRVHIYEESVGRYRCEQYSDHGVHIVLEDIPVKNSNDVYRVRMIINPRKLIDPGCSYLGILPPEKDSIKQVSKCFQKLFKHTCFGPDIREYQLARVDLCTNITCNHKKIFRELVRVLRKLPTPPKYERMLYKDKNRKKANRYNKHYLRFRCDSRELVIYDKTYQMKNNKLVLGYEHLPEGVIRFEVHCGRAYIRKVEAGLHKPNTIELLWSIMKQSQERMISHFARCFSDVDFVQIDELTQIINASTFKRKTKEGMLMLVEKLQRIQSVDTALEQMTECGYDTSGLLKKFTKLGVSPIPIWKSFCAKRLPGPVSLLRSVAEGNVMVEYVKAKYK